MNSYKLIEHGKPLPDGADLYDFIKSGWTKQEIIAWAKERVYVYHDASIQINNNVNISHNNTINNFFFTLGLNMVPAETDYEMVALWEKIGISCTKSGVAYCNEDNVARIFERVENLKHLLWWDEFHHTIFFQADPDPRELAENDIGELTILLQRMYGLHRISKTTVTDAISTVARRVVKNEPRDWMNSLTWDGIDRIRYFFSKYMGATETEYTRSASHNFFVGMVARVFQPGCIMRLMPILQGEQLSGKSTGLSIIGGKWYMEVLEDIHKKDFLHSLHGKLLVEFADMSGMFKADINRIKQIVSCRNDCFRRAYGRGPQPHLRQCTLSATTNEEVFLFDNTGGTRFMPIMTTTISLDEIERDRNQLFAEAVTRYKRQENYYFMPAKETKEAQEAHRFSHAWEDDIEDYIKEKYHQNEFTVREIMVNKLQIAIKDLDNKGMQMTVASLLKLKGLKQRQIKKDGRNIRVWEKISPKQEFEDLDEF